MDSEDAPRVLTVSTRLLPETGRHASIPAQNKQRPSGGNPLFVTQDSTNYTIIHNEGVTCIPTEEEDIERGIEFFHKTKQKN